MFSVNIIAACCNKRGIGIKNTLPWKIKEDMINFRKVTTGNYKVDIQESKKNIVIMGRNTWESIPDKFRPLSNRWNIVLTSKKEYLENCSVPIIGIKQQIIFDQLKNTFFVKDLDSIAELLNTILKNKFNEIFVIGGEKVYSTFLNLESSNKQFIVNKIYLTRINYDFTCDTFFPQMNTLKTNYFQISKVIEDFYFEKEIDNNIIKIKYAFYEYTRYSNHSKGEYEYLNLIENVINNGQFKDDRTGTGTISVFGCQTRYDLSTSFPLLTTKKMFVRGIIEELLWFMRGETDAKILQDKKVRIWDGNSSREFLDNRGLTHYKDGDCGPIYGFSFRHYGDKYVDCSTKYNGYDQVKECLRLIKEEPTSRRILINLWNPCDLDKVVLPPCHVLYQFYVNNGRLSCSLYQRSGDIGLGIPFNIASASLLTHMFAKLAGLKLGDLVHTIGDAHIYNDHIESLKTQLERTPKPFPILEIKDRNQQNPEDFSVKDFVFLGYESHPSIKMKMAI